ncbi:D-alanyl-D-alanine carboxypeptidase/D-alanyl-D-alanine-endopeptidase (penicillin-binding protein 4) [Streptomyces sp. Ag82_O1-15]|uniref:D-alanyl-D-alanine carboxypeptidase/D-alanyl-D-alanine endopeptidase n=1 Tax=Streptomyces sp. Ag82_O1-15 TaxID=1938855 RepID=UPI000BB124FC|nr:D-alanyl-D-alanine carboxypeptidase/D-alanyl-D-alanine-endopeptidase [Streptomyces sp. Ag82_O1-15]PBC97187.1 D-alanyl-D-alanine carboxypeptidase/D-alanyl-D-alanine-endopeptidase (penicillin-binding protein 4) [Streptomyces sp. Ag82_O1-15]
MVVPELRAWRAARPHVVRIKRTVQPHVTRVAQAVQPRVTKAAQSVRPHVVRAAQAVRPRPVKVTTPRLTAVAATAGLALAAGAVAFAGPWDSSGQRTAERDWAASREGEGGADHGRSSDTSTSPTAPKPAPSAASVLTGLGGSTVSVPAPTQKALTSTLDRLLGDPALGGRRTAVVVDVATGKRLYGKGADDAQTPASTTKIATAVAALSAAGADHRIETRAVLEPGTKEVVLVGGGDPTLTARKEAAGWASLRTLADETATALKARHLNQVTLSYDTSLYTGPALHPIGSNPNLAPVSALMVDEARTDGSASGPVTRAADPAADAAVKFAGLLEAKGIKTTTPGPSKATNRSQSLASVSSPPLSALIERMLTNSDNDIAEAMARQVALATGRAADFDGGAAAIDAELKKLGLPLSGAHFTDGSGLNRDDRLTADLLTALLVKAGDPAHPELRPILTGLPVAGFTGTLSDRYAHDASGTGLVRAKTGTLTGVNTLAGTVVDADGRLLAFAFLASDTTDPSAAQSALDRTASALAGCGCR